MPTVKLTDAAVARLKAPPGERIDYFDAAFPGLALRVTGAIDRRPERRSWSLFYRFCGKQRRLTFEPGYPALGLADARLEAIRAQRQIQAGTDPAASKAAAKAIASRAPDTVAAVAALYLAHLERRQKAPVYIRETKRNLENHVLPRWGDRDIKSITRRDAVELVNAVTDRGSIVKGNGDVTRRLAGGPVMARSVLSATRAMLHFAIDELEIAEVRPIRRLQGPVETPRDRTLTAGEIRTLWPRFSALGYPYGAALQLALLTGQRRQEIATLRWSDIDQAERLWTLPARNTKSGRSNIVPLSPLAIKILSDLPRLGPFVFTSTNGKAICGFSSAMARLAEVSVESETLERWTVHDLRRTCATELGRLGTPEFIISHVLNHASKGVTGRVYNRYEYVAEKRRALETWAQHLGGLTQPPSANVVALQARAS